MVKAHAKALLEYVRKTQYESYDLTLTYDQILELINQVNTDLIVQEYIELREAQTGIEDMALCDYNLISDLLRATHKKRGTLYE